VTEHPSLCQKDLEQSTVSLLECPRCGSSNVDCFNGFLVHRHECKDCHLREDIS
jgi:uncharacterized protein (DUF983 family)